MNKLFLLLVEDNEGDIVLTKEAFDEHNVIQEMAIARDGEEAIIFLKDALSTRKLPNLILLDVNLPKVNGHEVLRFIKGAYELKHIPVIMLTTSSSPTDILKGYQNYVNGYITKPVDAYEFLATVKQIEGFWIKTVKLPKP
jgi:CheY-like chemotaxis protein